MALEVKRLHLAELTGPDGGRWPVHGFVVVHPAGAVLVDPTATCRPARPATQRPGGIRSARSRHWAPRGCTFATTPMSCPADAAGAPT
jgi:hypothetical protein